MFALTPLQKGMLAESLVALDKGANLEQIVWELDHVPAVGRFRDAWQVAVDQFDALRLAFSWSEAGAEPSQAVLPSLRLPFRQVDLRAPTAAEQNARLERFLEEDRRAGFDLSSPPLMRVSLLVLGPPRAACVWSIHHTIIDGNCYAAVLQRVLDAYLTPERPAAGGTPRSFTEFLRWLERQDPGPGMRHFAELIRGFDAPTPLPLQEGRSRTAANRSSQVSLRVDASAAERLLAAAREAGATLNTLVQLAWALLLSRYSGNDDVVFGATWSGRMPAFEGADRVVGPMINTLPVRVRVGDAETVRELLATLRRQHLATRPLQQTAAAKIKAGSALAGLPHLFSTAVLFERSRFYSVLQAGDERWRGHRLWSRSQANLPLMLAAYLEDGDLVLELEYDLGLYAEAAARRLLADYERILVGLGDDLERPPFHVPMLDPSTRAKLSVEQVAHELVPGGPTAIARILERSALMPAAPAVKELGGREISYAELERRVRRLASALRGRGVERGTVVGVLLPRSIEAVVALLAVHAAGGAFVPLDPADAPQRLEFVVRDSGAKVVLVGRRTRGTLRSARGLELDVATETAPGMLDGPGQLASPDPEDPAYVIYTSGSTGEPKGVIVSHAALANHVAGVLDEFGLDPRDTVLQFTALTFDVSLEEILPTLAAGARLVLRSDAMTSSAATFFGAVAEEGISILNLPTSFWHSLVRAEHLAWPACVRLLVVGGEQVSPDALRRFRAAGTGHIRWRNAYGPTETTITSTCYDDSEGDHGPDFVPIGRPLPGVSHFVLDRHMRLTPIGEAGQLYIGGAGLALGYLGREALTRRRFVEHPYRPGARLFATGDRVRMTDAANYVYLGRLDDQIKLRGFRVEPGEIESRLRQHAAVSDAAVVVHEAAPDNKVLGAFVVADRRAVSAAQLREHLAAALPSYMVPSRIVFRSDLPTLPSGKVDRTRLAQLALAGPADPAPSADAHDPLVRSLLEAWTALLGRAVTDTSASFFELGGDSLLVVQMFTEIEIRLGKTCDAPAFLRNPTISNLAALLRSGAQTDWLAPVIPLARGEPGVRPLFLAPPLSGRGLDYLHLADALGGKIPVYALQTAVLPGPDPGTLAELARSFTRLIREVQPRGPYAVAGYSAAGIVAMAIAEELRAVGEVTDFVGLIDAVPPRSIPVPSPFGSPHRFVRLVRTAAGRVREVLGGGHALVRLRTRTWSALRRGLTRWNVLPLGYEPRATDAFEDVEARLSGAERDRMRRYFDLIWNHEFRKMDIETVLFRVALDPFEGPHEPELGWQRVTTGPIAVEYLSGTHERVLKREGSQELGPRLRAHLSRRTPSPG